MRRFWAEGLPPGAGGEVLLAEAESHHLLRVSGIAPGEEVELFDGVGGRARAVLLGVREGRALLRLDEHLPQLASLPTVLVLALLKRPAWELALRMVTELGVTELIPVVAARSVVRVGKVERWERIVHAAVTQSGRASLPVLQEPRSLEAALAGLPPHTAAFLARPGARTQTPPAGPLAVLVGPEGGWTPEEEALAQEAGARPLGLGPHTLKADTAAVSAVAWAAGRR